MGISVVDWMAGLGLARCAGLLDRRAVAGLGLAAQGRVDERELVRQGGMNAAIVAYAGVGRD
jgi:hypothetical protein